MSTPIDDDDASSSPQWRVLATLDPNKDKKRSISSNDNDDDEIITVSMLEHPSDPLCPYVKMETVIPIPVEKCWDFLSLDRWGETMPKMDPFYEGLDIYGEYTIREEQDAERDVETVNKQQKRRRQSGDNENETATKRSNKNDNENDSSDLIRMVLARKRTKRILAFGKREFVFVSVEDKPLEDGTWVSGTVSVEVDESSLSTLSSFDSNSNDSATALPSLRRNKSYTRAFQDSIAFYKPVPSMAGAATEAESSSREQNSNNDNSNTSCCTRKGWTKLTIVCRIDLNDSNEEYGSGGCIPMWLYVKTIGKTGARSVLSMRQSLLAEYV